VFKEINFESYVVVSCLKDWCSS